MKSRLIGLLSAAVLGAALTLPEPALAFRGGSFGGFHGGGGFGGFRGGFAGGGFSGFRGGFAGGGFSGFRGGMPFGGARAFAAAPAWRGGMWAGRSVFAPGAGRFAAWRGGWARPGWGWGRGWGWRHRGWGWGWPVGLGVGLGLGYAAWGAPWWWGGYYYGDYCWRQTWTPYGWEWINVCYGY
jgi:hypothetical protein